MLHTSHYVATFLRANKVCHCDTNYTRIMAVSQKMLLIICRLIVFYMELFILSRGSGEDLAMEKRDDSLNKILAKNIKQFRLKLGYSQEELADLCGCHRTYVGSVERGERNITLATLASLSKALGVSPIILLTPED